VFCSRHTKGCVETEGTAVNTFPAQPGMMDTLTNPNSESDRWIYMFGLKKRKHPDRFAEPLSAAADVRGIRERRVKVPNKLNDNKSAIAGRGRAETARPELIDTYCPQYARARACTTVPNVIIVIDRRHSDIPL